MSAALARVNLNLPPETRERLRSLAKAAKTPEAVYARGLLVEAIERAEHESFRRRLERSRNPELREREREIASALERLHG
jgi:predicted DNA-binding protein